MFNKETYVRRRTELKKLVKSGVVILFGNNESPVNYVTDGNALSTYLISQESQKMDQTLMAIQTKFTIATFIGDEKMFREAVDAYKKWILILKLRSSRSIH